MAVGFDGKRTQKPTTQGQKCLNMRPRLIFIKKITHMLKGKGVYLESS
jgi:hypothetical protein